ncbi:phosphate propanoyltransferase [Sutcliffiella rhizosphaerae]|uniref:Phosphate propanoyltransferase n=1 Tax=Sutcliffiella rhizosphaerae TaxID=2880967 RepID=A0ABN8A8N9_9BACI|nr:phosphate propanoyltransferase [Sutcliffiella rhizosphaerae]CAG9619992.1 Phosphate propanoyltransferase [Sutcliffiella rhizosphaerae]
MERARIKALVQEVVRNTLQVPEKQIPIAVSNRHVHLSPEHVERLFGRGYELTKQKDLSQPNQFAAKETVTLIGPKGRIANVRVLGPARGATQVEISLFDGYTLGVKPPIRQSGDIAGSESITLMGPRGQLRLEEGLICASRHIHMHPDDSIRLGVKNGNLVDIKVNGERATTFSNVLIRVSEKYSLEMHIDLDEANAANISNGTLGELIAVYCTETAEGGCGCGCKGNS